MALLPWWSKGHERSSITAPFTVAARASDSVFRSYGTVLRAKDSQYKVDS